MGKKRIFTEEEIDLMIQMYNDGETYKEIGKYLHTKDTTVSSILSSLGYKKRKKNTLKNCDFLSASRKNKLNENFFKEIDTEEKAYWLGFLYADGCVCKRSNKNGNEKGGFLELTLQSRDKYHIQNFLSALESDAPISDKKIKLGEKEYFANRVCISSIKMVNDLIYHGCVENKSLILQPPTTVDNSLISHFIRGYFDGDGCVAFYPNYSSYKYSIIGTESMLKFIVDSSQVQSYSIRSFDNKKCYELIILSKESVKIFHNYIYSRKSIYLERKYQKSLSMMKWCSLKDCRNDTQKLADLMDSKLLLNDEILNDFNYYKYMIRSETAAMADLLG